MKLLFTVPVLASDGGFERFNLLVVHDRWAYKILTRLLLWPAETEVSQDCGEHHSRYL